MKDYFLSLINSGKNLPIPSVFSSVLHAMGIMWVVVEISSFFSNEFSTNIKPYWWLFLLGGLIMGLARVWPARRIYNRIANTDIIIEILVRNVLEVEGDLIVGSNTTFDTSIEDNTISSKSIQGQFTEKYCDIGQLDQQIENSLTDIRSVELDPGIKPYGKRSEYDIGTIASVRFGNKRAYFVAIAKLNAHRVATASRIDIANSLPMIWEYIRERGGIEPLACPILGSGYSRMNATREETIREIIKSFIAGSLQGKFCEKLSIAIATKDYIYGRVNLPKLKQFLEHECTYSWAFSKDVSEQPVGEEL